MIKLIPVLLALLAALYSGCMQDGGTEIPNEARPGEIRGREFLAGAGPASGAELRLVPAGFVPSDSARLDSAGAVVRAATSDAAGRFVFDSVPAGVYNLLAADGSLRSFRDSLVVEEKEGLSLADDTLRAPGSLAGRVVLQPQDDARSATVHVLGTQVHVNVAADGAFILPDLADGTYRLRVSTILPGYVPLFREVRVRSGRADSLPAPLEPVYIGVPVVTGLTAVPGPGGTVILNWNQTAYPRALGYYIYRDSAGTVVPTTTPMRRVSGTVFIDTLYATPPRPGQHPYTDTVPHAYSYRVAILDQGGAAGPTFGFVEVTARPPTAQAPSGLWKKAVEAAPFGPRQGHSLVAFKDRLWLFGGGGADSTDIWSSGDGLEWRREAGAPFPSGTVRAVVFKERLWVLGSDSSEYTSTGYTYRCFLWNSEDGARWSEVEDSLPIPQRNHPALAVLGDRLFVMDGMHIEPAFFRRDVWSSADGKAWRRESEDVKAWGAAVLGYRGRLRILGGGDNLTGDYNDSLLSSADGKAWTSKAGPAGLLPRHSAIAAEHDGSLWFYGGMENVVDVARPSLLQDVWSSPDGETWTRIDAKAPFGARMGAAMASFQGRLWFIGGRGSAGSLSDIWYLESP